MKVHRVLLKSFVVSLCFITACFSKKGFAADTVEVWDKGAIDFEFYLGAEGIGAGTSQRQFFGETVIGFGLTQKVSGYISLSMQAEGGDGSAYHTLTSGIFGNVIDTVHFDVDLFFDVSLEQGQIAWTPSVEVNFDLKEDLSLAGLYIRTGLPVYVEDRFDVRSHVEFTAGAYLTLGNHQILGEFSLCLHPFFRTGEKFTDERLVAIGYNVVLTQEIELISEAHVNFAPDGTEVLGVTLGIIATVF